MSALASVKPTARDINLTVVDQQDPSSADLDKAIKFAGLAGKAELKQQIKVTEKALEAAKAIRNAHAKDLRELLATGLEKEALKNPHVVALAAALRPFAKGGMTAKKLVHAVDLPGRGWPSMTSFDGLGEVIQGGKFRYYITTRLELSIDHEANEDMSIELLKPMSRAQMDSYEDLATSIHAYNRAADTHANLEEKLKNLPDAVEAVEAQVLRHQLEQTDSGKMAIGAVTSALAAHLNGNYMSLLPG